MINVYMMIRDGMHSFYPLPENVRVVIYDYEAYKTATDEEREMFASEDDDGNKYMVRTIKGAGNDQYRD